MDTLFEILPDDVEALKAALLAERLNARNALAAQLQAEAELLHAEAIAAIALADVAQARALIEELKNR